MNESSPSGTGYQVIARRYRPRFFHEVVGQEATSETLRQSIINDRIAHAYLFCGPRGVGKTSMARIFARALQCPESDQGNPCDGCATCDRIFRGEDMNVTEMDAASHRGIEDVRDLIQHVRYAPTDGRFRVFIVDEVHMLTREAFNAFLKTLEEPPAHVKFIFCTTEPEKMPDTVISRCQRCDFSAISNEHIVLRLEQICEAEGAQPEAGLLQQVADLARGGMRDSQSLLDQLLSFAGNTPTLEDLDRITGRLSPTAVGGLLDLVEGGERAKLVKELDGISKSGTDPAVVLEQVVEELRRRLHTGVDGDWGNAEIERNLVAQEILQEARLKVRQLSRADIVLETALLRVATLGELLPLDRWLDAAEGRIPPGEALAPPTRASGGAEKPAPVAQERVSEPAPAPQSASVRDEPPSRQVAPEPAANPPVPDRAPVQAQEAGAEAAASEPSPPTDDRSLARRALATASPILERMVIDQGIIVERDQVCFELARSGLRQLDAQRKENLRRELQKELGRPVRLVVREATRNDEQLLPDAPVEDGTIPDIVEKAREIFRGTLDR